MSVSRWTRLKCWFWGCVPFQGRCKDGRMSTQPTVEELVREMVERDRATRVTLEQARAEVSQLQADVEADIAELDRDRVAIFEEKERLRVENARLRETLEQYADESSWLVHDGWCDWWIEDGHGWELARAALELPEEES